ncbi:MAG: VWA domain-containing protein [Terriglobia bacterium]
MRTRCGGWIFVFCLLLVTGLAQQNGPAAQSEPPASVPPGNADSRITLDVVVTDKSGRPLPGLQQQDFTLLDNKQPAKIVSFQAVQGGAATADPPVEVILVVDNVNASVSQVAFERDQIERFLRRNGGQLARPVSTAVFSDSGIVIGDTSSRDGNAVLADFQQKKTGLHSMVRSQGFYGAYERLQLSLHSLDQLAANEEPKPGRKLVVWISPGWPLLNAAEERQTTKQQEEIFNYIVAFSDRLRQAGITLYEIDPLGAEDASEFRTFEYKQFLKPVKKAGQAQFGDLALQVLASQSGGRVFNSNNDVTGEIEACVADSNSFYVLSFDGLPGDGPNEYHALEIKIDKPGLTARTRTGYYAQPDH